MSTSENPYVHHDGRFWWFRKAIRWVSVDGDEHTFAVWVSKCSVCRGKVQIKTPIEDWRGSKQFDRTLCTKCMKSKK